MSTIHLFMIKTLEVFQISDLIRSFTAIHSEVKRGVSSSIVRGGVENKLVKNEVDAKRTPC